MDNAEEMKENMLSLLVRECGLKSAFLLMQDSCCRVTSRARVWIEILEDLLEL